MYQCLFIGTGSNGTCTLCFFPIDNTISRDDPVMKSVMTTIESSINDADNIHQLVPFSWIKTIDELTNLNRSSITIQEYSSIYYVKQTQMNLIFFATFMRWAT